MSSRAVDHLVLPVGDLGIARARLTALGFTVAPDALHPFGTANSCVFFVDGTYLEPLAIANRRQMTTTAKRGNTFTARDLAFRKTRNREGLSAIVVRTEDAQAEHARFIEHGLSAGEMLEFSRPMTLADGAESEASFRLAFAGEADAPDYFMFACQRINPLPADRGELERHENGVVGLSEIVFSTSIASESVSVLEEVMQAKAEQQPNGLHIDAANARIRISEASELELEFALHGGGTGALVARAVIFKTVDLAVTEITLAANDVAFIRREGRVLVSAMPGQGVLFGFEE